MPSLYDALGPISEMLTWIGLVPGLLLLFASMIMRHFDTQWRLVEGVVYVSGNETGYRWFDEHFEIHEAPVPPREATHLVPGADIELYYDPRKPSQWRLTLPHQAGGVPFALGWVFTGVGLAALIAGFILPML